MPQLAQPCVLGKTMRRRELIKTILGLVSAWPVLVLAQRSTMVQPCELVSWRENTALNFSAMAVRALALKQR
jgi:hypothetical protein